MTWAEIGALVGLVLAMIGAAGAAGRWASGFVRREVDRLVEAFGTLQSAVEQHRSRMDERVDRLDVRVARLEERADATGRNHRPAEG